MTTQMKGRHESHLVAGRRWLPAAVLLLVSGCQTSPAQPSGCTPATANLHRYRALTRQILCDTGTEIVHHPLRASRTVLEGEAAWFCSVGRGIFGKRLGMRLHGRPALCLGTDGIDPALIETELQPAAVQLYPDGLAALTVLEQLIDSAQRSIDILIYTWEDDAVGWDVAQHLAAAAAHRCRVRILLDGGANLIFAPSPTEEPSVDGASKSRRDKPKTAGEVNRVVCWLAQQPGVELVRIRNPFARFDHRKLVLIDGQQAWAGGRNFTHTAFFLRHDITFTMQGPLVAEWQTLFECYWREQGGKPARLPPQNGVVPIPSIVANAAGRLVENAPTHHGLSQALYRAIDHARHFVYLENPYLTDNGVIVKLARARRRGVDARVLFTIRSDTPSINHTNKVTANRLLAAGVRVYLYPGRIHVKAALVDGCWAYLGSGNFDLLSLHRNHELGVVFGPGPFLEELNQVLFQPDFNPDWELHAPLPLTAADYAYELLAAFFL
jgi:cardiolipin synthase